MRHHNMDDVTINHASTEIYKFWNKLPTKIQNNIENWDLGALILKVVNSDILSPDKLRNLYKVTQMFPGSCILNLSGMPILKIKKQQEKLK